jgi:hypothetical protein
MDWLCSLYETPARHGTERLTEHKSLVNFWGRREG